MTPRTRRPLALRLSLIAFVALVAWDVGRSAPRDATVTFVVPEAARGASLHIDISRDGEVVQSAMRSVESRSAVAVRLPPGAYSVSAYTENASFEGDFDVPNPFTTDSTDITVSLRE